MKNNSLIRKLAVLVISLVIIAGCKKDDSSSTDSSQYRLTEYNEYDQYGTLYYRILLDYQGDKLITAHGYYKEAQDSIPIESQRYVIEYPYSDKAICTKYLKNEAGLWIVDPIHTPDEITFDGGMVSNCIFSYGYIYDSTKFKFERQFVNGQCQNSTHYRYNSGVWVPTRKDIYVYNGSKIAAEISNWYDLIGTHKDTLICDGDKYKSLMGYNLNGTSWTNTYRIDFTYTGNNISKFEANAFSNGQWSSDGGRQYTYDEHNNLVLATKLSGGARKAIYKYEQGKGNFKEIIDAINGGIDWLDYQVMPDPIFDF